MTSRSGLAALALVGSACVAIYASQLFLGRWQTDEYRLFTTERLWGWHALIPRLAYSPRPFSEGLLFLYGKAVLAANRPLIISFLGLLWAAVLGLSMLAARNALPPSRARWFAVVGLVTTLFAFVLVNNKVTETFYWPMAAAAYMPTGGSAVVLLFLLSGAPSPTQRIGSACALLVAAGSSEVGAALACGFAVAASVDAILRRSGPSPHDAWWIIPGLLGLAVFLTIFSLRANVAELGAVARPATGHPWLDLRLAVREFAIDLLGGGSGQEPMTPGKFADELLFAAAFASVWRQAGGNVPTRSHALLLFSVAIAAFFSLFAAYFHYGTACCERHAVTRQWLIDVLLILLAGFALHRLRTGRLPWLSPLLLAVSLYPLVFRIDGMRADFSVYNLAIESRARTWASGLRKMAAMKLYLPPDGSRMLIRGTNQPIGTFQTARDAPEMVGAVGGFFGKSVVIVCEPWQTEKSWLLNGHFIPACPPHGGPPDIVYDSRR